MRTWLKGIAIAATIASIALVVPTSIAQAAPYCGITWGSLDKAAGTLSNDALYNVRAGRHACFDRLVMDVTDVDVGGTPAGYTVRYVSAVRQDGSGNVVPLRGGAFLEIVLQVSTSDPFNGSPTYLPINPRELVNVNGYQTFRQVASGGSFEGYTTIGLGVRARLPFRVFTLDGPADGSRVVIDVAHRW
ncbi:MAG: hypothetical protein H0T40_12840 [Geodermatophilaceae bacterium]|nr:hypothetical protein [Geodermatophilaceae bacterium]